MGAFTNILQRIKLLFIINTINNRIYHILGSNIFDDNYQNRYLYNTSTQRRLTQDRALDLK